MRHSEVRQSKTHTNEIQLQRVSVRVLNKLYNVAKGQKVQGAEHLEKAVNAVMYLSVFNAVSSFTCDGAQMV